MKVVTLTKRQVTDGSAYADWCDAGTMGRLGGPFAQMIMAQCEDDDPVSIVALDDNRTPIGQIHLLKGQLQLDQSIVDVYWGSGLLVHSADRASGAGLAIMARLRSLGPATGACSVSLVAAPLYHRLGWIGLTAPRYVMPVQPSTFIAFRFGCGVIPRLVGLAADAASRVYRAGVVALLSGSRQGLHVERIDRFDDKLVEQFSVHSTKRFRTARSAAIVNRLLALGPQDNGRQLFVVRDAPKGRMLGYIIISNALRSNVGGGRYGDLNVASLRDWVTFDAGRLSEARLIRIGLRELLRCGRTDVIELCIPDRSLGPLLRCLGMLRLGEMHFVVRVTTNLEVSAVELRDPRNWWFRPGDGDAFLL